MLFHCHRNKWTQSWCLKPRQMYCLMVLQVTGLTQLLLEWNRSVKGCVPPGGSRGGCTCSPFPPSRGSPSCLGPGPFPYQSPPVTFSHAWLWHSFADAALLTHSFCPHLPHLQIFLMTLGHCINWGNLWHHHIVRVPLSHVRWQSWVVEVNMRALGSYDQKGIQFQFF